MLNQIIEFSLRQRLVVLLVAAGLLFYGTWTAREMDVDVFPDLTAPMVTVMTEARGFAPEEVERLVAYPIETSLNGAGGVRRVRSQSGAGIGFVWVEFDWGTDIYKARQIVSERLQTLAGRFPVGVATPILAPQSSIMGEIMIVGLSATETSPRRLRTLADRVVRPRLLSTGGVSQVVVMGGEFRQFQVLANPRLMSRFGIGLDELTQACREANVNASGGFHREYGNEYIVRGIARTENLSQLGNTVVKLVGGYPVKVLDVATVEEGAAPAIGNASVDASPAVLLMIQKQPGINTLELTHRLETTFAHLQASLPDDVRMNTRIFRQADFISASVNNVQRVLLEGSIFVVIILALFLMNARATFISLIALPLSLVAAILTLKWLGLSINTMSLGGMAIAVGDLVDDAIIDVENVWRRLRENHAHPPEARRPVLRVVYDASVEIRASVINATFIIIAAFLPLFFLSGMEGRMLEPLGIAFVVSLFASLVVALTVTPVLCSLLLTKNSLLEKHHHDAWLVRKLKLAYTLGLQRALRAKVGLLAGAFVLFIGAMALLSGFGRSFLPEFNEGSLVVSAMAMPGISLDESDRLGRRLELALHQVPEIRQTARRVGRAELDEHAMGVNATEIEAPFDLQEREREEFLADVRGKLATVPGLNITVGQPLGHRIDHMLSGTRASIAVKLFGPDLQTLFRWGNAIQQSTEGISGLVDVAVDPQTEIPQIQIRARREMLARYGITPGAFAQFVRVAIGGEKVGDIYEDGLPFDVVLRFDTLSRGSLRRLQDALIDTERGYKVPLASVADVISATGPNTISRENVQRKVVVSANVAGRDLLGVIQDMQARIAERAPTPGEGYRIEFGGQFESEARATRTLLLASLASLLAIFILLFQEFRSLRLAGIIMLNLPLALIGGVFAVWAGTGIISIPVAIGFITLFGVATRSGILLVSHYHALEAEGLPLRQVILQGSLDRLSPILMTALTAALALIPLALAASEPGNEIQSPMARVILGGLLTSTLLNLFIVPCVYLLAHPKSRKTNVDSL